MKLRRRTPKPKKTPLTEKLITKWVKQFHSEEGYYPTNLETKGVPDQPLESWSVLNAALTKGGRGLPGGSSLAKIRNKLVGLTVVGIRVVPTEVREVEGPRTLPLVPEHQRLLIPQLPVLERGILMRYLEGETQAAIGELYGVTQAAISYKIQRSLLRLEFLEHLERLPLQEFREGLTRLDVEPETRKILLAMRRYTCQSKVAQKLNLTQGKVRHRLFQAVHQLKPRNLQDVEVLRQIELLRDNPGLKHEFYHKS
jgi:DNA-directed RNA polymerase specialized sigma24 family protein